MISGAVAVGWLVFVASPMGDMLVPFFRTKNMVLMGSAIKTLLSLGCIWFAEDISDFYSAFGSYMPSGMVALMGWLLLLAPLIGVSVWTFA